MELCDRPNRSLTTLLASRAAKDYHPSVDLATELEGYSMELKSRPVTYAEGGYRLHSADEALKEIDESLEQYGIVCKHIPLAPYCDLGFQADCFVGEISERERGVGNHMHFGKGSTPLQSLLSGKYETVERISSCRSAKTQFVRGTHKTLLNSGLRAVDPVTFALPGLSEVGRTDSYLSTVRSAYSANASLDWVEVWSVRDSCYVYLPTCFVNSIHHNDLVNNICHNRPNGLSSGTCLEEAVLGGLLELIERDACCLFAIHSLPVPNVDPESIAIPSVQAFLRNAAIHGVEVTIKNCTTSLGIPAFCTFLHDPSPDAPRASSGAGAHISKEIALIRSVAEACLERAANLWQLPSHRSMRPELIPEKLRWEATQYTAKALGSGGWRSDYVHQHKKVQDFADLPTGSCDDLKEAIEKVLGVLTESGIGAAYVADLTQYDIPTVRVVVPDLEFAPNAWYRVQDPEREQARRLWQEPLRMGYVEGEDFQYLQGLGNDHLL